MSSAMAGSVTRRFARLALLLATVGAVIGATGARAGVAHAAPTGEFAGRVDGTEAFVAVVTNGTQVFAFVCDGRDGAYTG